MTVFKAPQRAHFRFAQHGRLFQHRIEHRGEIAGRRIDDLQHLGHRALAGERFVTLGAGLFQLAAQRGDGFKRLGGGVVGHPV